jgi:hypothetical protein
MPDARCQARTKRKLWEKIVRIFSWVFKYLWSYNLYHNPSDIASRIAPGHLASTQMQNTDIKAPNSIPVKSVSL